MDPTNRESYVKVKYKTPREALGKWLALNTIGGVWSDHFNEEQKEYWYLKADDLLEFQRKNGLFK
jgi:hypothetical protein